MAQQEEIAFYLSNLNQLSKRFPETENITRSNCDDCENISDMIDLLKISCGEKIVVDFDNEDGWTWRDEHSGPFSWMTRSQQDLTDLNLDFEPVNTADKSISRKISFTPDDSANTPGLSEIQAAFQKFGLKSIDESEISQQTIEAHIETTPVKGNSSVISETDEVASTLSSQSTSPAHHPVSSPQAFSPIHQPITANTRRKWSNADCSDTEAEESLISNTHTGHISTGFEVEPNKFLSNPVEDQIPVELAGVHGVSHHDNATVEDTTEVCVDNKDDTIDKGYDNTGIDLGLDLTTESSSDLTKTGFDFLDDW